MGRRILLLAVLGGGLAGCGARDLPVQEDDLLVLELGGTHETLRSILGLTEQGQVLVHQGVAKARSSPAENTRPGIVPSASQVAAERQLAVEITVPKKTRPAPPRYYEVTLQPGQTLYELCRLHLATPSRWREVMQLNGLQEDELRRLPAGRKIRLPSR